MVEILACQEIKYTKHKKMPCSKCVFNEYCFPIKHSSFADAIGVVCRVAEESESTYQEIRKQEQREFWMKVLVIIGSLAVVMCLARFLFWVVTGM